jgi:hypothetical protein
MFSHFELRYRNTYIHSCFIPEGVAEASRIFFPDAHVLPKLLSYEEADHRLIVVYLRRK